MKKYNLSKIMKRAWEIKKSADRRSRKMILNLEVRDRELKESEKALFSECLKMSWEEAKRAEEIAEAYGVSMDNAEAMAQKEAELKADGHYGILWNIWTGCGRRRAYFKCGSMSKYQNSKKDHYVSLAA